MKQQAKDRLIGAVAGGFFCGFGLLSFAMASPPASRGRPLIQPEPRSVARLDLRPLADHKSSAAPVAFAPFSSPAPRVNLGKADAGQDDRGRPRWATNELNVQTMSKAQILARRIQREGVPVAHLWDSKTAFLSIGLNPKGKPGLWLVQKVH